MQLEINGTARDDITARTVAELVEQLGLDPRTVLVERNEMALLRSEWQSTELAEGDRIEILRVAAGG